MNIEKEFEKLDTLVEEIKKMYRQGIFISEVDGIRRGIYDRYRILVGGNIQEGKTFFLSKEYLNKSHDTIKSALEKMNVDELDDDKRQLVDDIKKEINCTPPSYSDDLPLKMFSFYTEFVLGEGRKPSDIAERMGKENFRPISFLENIAFILQYGSICGKFIGRNVYSEKTLLLFKLLLGSGNRFEYGQMIRSHEDRRENSRYALEGWIYELGVKV